MIQRRFPLWLILFCVLLISGTAAHSLAQDSACPALVELAISQVGDNCAGLGRNVACYGYNSVQATFSQSVNDGFFSRPADRSRLEQVRTLTTAPLDLGLGQWGIAVMNVQANVPDTLPGQAVTFMLFGNTEIENAVEPIDESITPVTVITQSAVDLRSGPTTNSAVVTTFAPGTVLDATGLSEDGTALQVSSTESTGWIDRVAVNANPALDALPIIGNASQTPMQSFYFRTRPDGLECSQTPSVLAIQSPEGITVNLNANGADIQIGSLIVLEILDDGRTMRLTVLDGEAVLEGGIVVPQGFTTTRCLVDPEDLGSDGEANDQIVGDECPWLPPEPAPQDLLERLQTVSAAFDRIGQTPLIETNTPGPSPTASLIPTETATPQPTATATVTITPTAEATQIPPSPAATACATGTQLTHVIQEGENLFRIAQRYRTDVDSIAQANGITDPARIFAGQTLIILCGVDTGRPSSPPTPLPNVPTPVSNNPGVNCAAFRATSPLDGFAYGRNTFYWDSAPGATSYRVVIYGVDENSGAVVGSFETSAPNTSLTASMTIDSVGFGFQFAWEVQALINGQVACTSSRTSIPRAPEGSVATNPPPPPFSAIFDCVAYSIARVQWFNAPAGTTSLTISVNSIITPPPPITLSNPPASGSVNLPPFFAIYSGGTVVASPSGASLTLGSLGPC
jgi:LysM repeat protein